MGKCGWLVVEESWWECEKKLEMTGIGGTSTVGQLLRVRKLRKVRRV